jgi:hypothetical protein
MTVNGFASVWVAAAMAATAPMLRAQVSLNVTSSGVTNSAHFSQKCPRPDLMTDGNPTFAPTPVPEGQDLSVGVSLAKHEFHAGESIVIHIWMANSSSRPASVWSCRGNSGFGLEYFQWKGFDLYNETNGRRILNREQRKAVGDGSTLKQQCSTDEGRFQLMGVLMQCLANGPVPIPPHACMTRDDSFFTFDLLKRYDLPPGKYSIRFREGKKDPDDLCHSMPELPWHGSEDPNLTFSVIQP